MSETERTERVEGTAAAELAHAVEIIRDLRQGVKVSGLTGVLYRMERAVQDAIAQEARAADKLAAAEARVEELREALQKATRRIDVMNGWAAWLLNGEVLSTARDGLKIDLQDSRDLLKALRPLAVPAVARPGDPPGACPACGGPRHWERPATGGLDAVCPGCGRRGAHDA